MDLDEYSEEQLIKELTRRYDLTGKGKCSYCGRPTSEDPCRFPKRHTLIEEARDTDRRLTFAKLLATMLGKKLINRRVRKRIE